MDFLLKRLYQSEINVSISWMWDGGIDVKIGDKMNGFKEEETFGEEDFEGVKEWLELNAKRLYPKSAFALTYKGDNFDSAVNPAIRYLFKNHNPHTKIYIDYDTAELLQSQECHNLTGEVPD